MFHYFLLWLSVGELNIFIYDEHAIKECGMRMGSYSLARFLIQIGVPTNPNARRIWFSINRS